MAFNETHLKEIRNFGRLKKNSEFYGKRCSSFVLLALPISKTKSFIFTLAI